MACQWKTGMRKLMIYVTIKLCIMFLETTVVSNQGSKNKGFSLMCSYNFVLLILSQQFIFVAY